MSEIWLRGDGNASLEAGSGRARPVLADGAPPVHLIDLTLHSPVHVEAGELRVTNCAWRGAGGPRVDRVAACS